MVKGKIFFSFTCINTQKINKIKVNEIYVLKDIYLYLSKIFYGLGN